SPPVRRQHPGHHAPRRTTGVDLRCPTRASTRPDLPTTTRHRRRLVLGRLTATPAEPGRCRLPRRRPGHPHPDQTTRRRQAAGTGQPHLQHPATSTTRPRRTRLRPAHRPMARPETHHRQPQQNRRLRPGCSRTHPLRTPLPHRFLLRSPHCKEAALADRSWRFSYLDARTGADTTGPELAPVTGMAVRALGWIQDHELAVLRYQPASGAEKRAAEGWDDTGWW